MTECSIKSSVVPIMYMGGTGGHFVASLLHNAKLNKSEIPNISESGSCHFTDIELKNLGGIFNSLESKITELRLMNLTFDSTITYYWPLHDKEIDHVMKEFDRCIKITYTEKDIPEINAAIYIKWGVEGKNTVLKYDRFKRRNTVFLKEYNKFFRPDIDYGERVLNISWYELYHSNDIDRLIKKFSDFTGIAISNFSKEFIIQWRTLTHFGFSKIDQLNIDNGLNI